jgi:hypothetical protein
MLISYSYIQQDTVPRKTIVNHDSVRVQTDSTSTENFSKAKESVSQKSVSVIQKTVPVNNDTTSVCTRNSIADVTFYDFNNFILRIGYGSYKQFPFVFTEKVRQQQIEAKAHLIKQLKPGTDLPVNPLHSDWMILIVLLCVFLFSLVKKMSGRLSQNFNRFFLFRGINYPVSHDLGGLFHWQSTILNLVSFIIIGLFGYSVASYFEIVPGGFKGIIVWLISLGIISSAVTLRHIACLITGEASGEQEAFREYLLGIYQAYRFGALFLFMIFLLITYTRILPVQGLILTGIIVVGLLYLFRFIRLLIIFLNRNISIFYLILYLCALEILPVLIVIKYITGLV